MPALIAKSERKTVKAVQLNMTPMIDCVFLLLLFFMVGAKFKELDRKLDTDLPKAGKPNPKDKDTELFQEIWIQIAPKRGPDGQPIVVQVPAVRFDGSTLVGSDGRPVYESWQLPYYKVNNVPVKDESGLREKLRGLARPDSLKDPVIIDVTDNSQHGWVMTALDYLNQFGFKNINFKYQESRLLRRPR